MFTTVFYMTLCSLTILLRLPSLSFHHNLILESPWLGLSMGSDSMLWLLTLFNMCDSAKLQWYDHHILKNRNLFYMGWVRWENFKLCIIFNFTRCLKVQCRSIFKTLPWSFSVKMHLYANYTLQCTPESVLLCTFPKLQENS